jgi:hypothetical protein
MALVTGGVLALLLALGVFPGAPTGGELAAAASPTKPPRLRPDLVALPAKDLHIAYSAGGVRKLRFESALGNIGDGPIEVRPNRARSCPRGKHHASQIFYRDSNRNGRYDTRKDTGVARRSAGCMVFHPYHNHWHFEAASRYTLYKAQRPRASKVANRKMSFCLRDSERVPEQRFGDYPYNEAYGACSRHSPQGISVGWVDVYQSFLAGQAVRFPSRMGDGLYCLHTKVDPQDQLLETQDGNNTSVRAFYVRGDRISYRKWTRCRARR